jgi:hypothetical protein
MKKINTHQMSQIGGSGEKNAHAKILGCSLATAAVGASLVFSAGLLTLVGAMALTQAGCVAIEIDW